MSRSYELHVGPIPEGLEIDHVKARGCACGDGMSAPMDGYTEHLWGMAWERFDRTLAGWFTVHKRWNSGYIVEYAVSPGIPTIRTEPSPTLADALCALLRDLGIEPPERPSAEDVASLPFMLGVSSGMGADPIEVLRDLYNRDAEGRLTVLEMLNGGAS